jgi:hypothetical protein
MYMFNNKWKHFPSFLWIIIFSFALPSLVSPRLAMPCLALPCVALPCLAPA